VVCVTLEAGHSGLFKEVGLRGVRTAWQRHTVQHGHGARRELVVHDEEHGQPALCHARLDRVRPPLGRRDVGTLVCDWVYSPRCVITVLIECCRIPWAP
jgi:hypothetical protein